MKTNSILIYGTLFLGLTAYASPEKFDVSCEELGEGIYGETSATLVDGQIHITHWSYSNHELENQLGLEIKGKDTLEITIPEKDCYFSKADPLLVSCSTEKAQVTYKKNNQSQPVNVSYMSFSIFKTTSAAPEGDQTDEMTSIDITTQDGKRAMETRNYPGGGCAAVTKNHSN